jgi:hypothetical protein
MFSWLRAGACVRVNTRGFSREHQYIFRRPQTVMGAWGSKGKVPRERAYSNEDYIIMTDILGPGTFACELLFEDVAPVQQEPQAPQKPKPTALVVAACSVLRFIGLHSEARRYMDASLRRMHKECSSRLE